jgi:branched-chain amino acid transport system permease protein
MGVKPDTVISATFVIGAGLAALAGVMYAANYGSVQHTMGFLPGLKAFTAAVFGGIGNLAGAMVGGVLLGLIESLGAGYIGDFTGGVLGSHYQDIFAFIVLILVLTLRPQGPARRARRRPRMTRGRVKRFSDASRQQKLVVLIAAVVLLRLPFMVQMAGNAWVRIIDIALLYVLLALGLNIVVGYAGLLDLGYVAFYAVGAYTLGLLASPQLTDTFASLAQAFEHGPAHAVVGRHPLGAVVAGGAGVLLGAPTLKLRGDYLAIVTLGFGEIVRVFLNNLDAPVNITNGPKGITGIDEISMFGYSLGKTHDFFGLEWPKVTNYYFLFLLLVIFASSSASLERSRIGRAWMAIREDEVAAKAMGINTRNLKLLAFGMGATFGGVSGVMFASFQGFISPESFSLPESVMIVAMVVLGGIGHLPGVIVGCAAARRVARGAALRRRAAAADDRRPPRRVDPAPAADRAGDDRHHAVAPARPLADAGARQGSRCGAELPPPRGPGGEMPAKVHVELAPAEQIPPLTGHIVPTDR